MKFIRNNKLRPFAACISEMPTALTERLLVTRYMHALSMHAIEDPLLGGTRTRRTSGKASTSDNFCPREFTGRQAVRRAERT